MRPIDAVQVLNNINWHHKPTPVSEFESGFNGGLNQAMWIITHAPTLTPPNEWVSVEERLPEHLKDVIALYGNGRIDIDWVDSSGDFKFGSIFDGVTHWMPLPAPPDCRPPEGEGNA